MLSECALLLNITHVKYFCPKVSYFGQCQSKTKSEKYKQYTQYKQCKHV